MSQDHISDSENDENQDTLIIDKKLLSNQLLQLTPTKREVTRKRLQELTNISFEVIDETKQSTNEDLPVINDLLPSNNDINEDSDESDMDTLDLIRRLPPKVTSNISRTTSISHDREPEIPGTTTNTTTHDDQENEHHLQSYLNTTNSYITMSGRSLRKRNFASTHPYLADQAHYLGLSDINYLNEIYEENHQNLEDVVRYLNYNYIKLKGRYPKDEKYKSKSFYTIISRQSHIAQENERQEEKESQSKVDNDEHPENSDLDNEDNDDEENNEFTLHGYNSQDYETDESSNEPDDLLEKFRRHHPMIIDDDDIDQSDSDSDKSEAYVQVGGKFRKEKNALRGVLPESAKRLSIYTSAKKLTRKQRQFDNLVKPRKGMAVRKTVRRRARERDDFSGFVDDNITYDTNNELYHELYDQPVEIEQSVAQNFHSFDNSDPFSDASSSSEVDELDHDSDLDIFGVNGTVAVKPDEELYAGDVASNLDMIPPVYEVLDSSDVDKKQSESSDVFDFEVPEGDYINHMLATGSRGNLKGKKRQLNGTEPRISNSKYYKANARRNPRLSKSLKSLSSGARESSFGGLHYRSRKPKKNDITNYSGIWSSGKKSKTSRKSLDDSYSRLRVKKISMPRDLHETRKSKSSIKTRVKKHNITMHKDARNQMTRRTRDLFANDYLFLRTPVLSTTIFEAESKTRFVNNMNRTINPSAPQIAPELLFGLQPIFDHGCLLNEINLKKITDLASGKFYQMNKDSVTINDLGEPVVLTLVDIDGSTLRYEKSLNNLAKIFKNGQMAIESIMMLFYTTMKDFLIWNLILQRTPNPRQWKLTQLLVLNILNCNTLTSSMIKTMIPYCLLLQYTMAMISQLNDFNANFDLTQVSVRYWHLFFDTFSLDTFESYNIDTGAKLKDAESFFIMCALLDNEKKWWSTISSAIELYDPMDINVLLEAVFCISSIPQNHLSWNPLQLVYLKADYSTYPEFYYRYLEIVYLMNQRNNWPIDEKIVLQIYASITVRKFANFPDEIGFPELMSKVSTRLDIPGDTFFEQFMQLLYWYISGLSDPSKVKRLVTKLFSNNSFLYTDDHEHRIMFTNRLNFIILLALVSSVDLKTQLTNLLASTQLVNDMKFLKLAANGVLTLTEIYMSRKLKLPIEGISLVVQCCICNYFTGIGVLKFWNKFVNSIRDLLSESLDYVPHMVQFLALSKVIDGKNIPDRINTDIFQLYSIIAASLVKQKHLVMPKYRKSIEQLEECVSFLLQKQMGRIPLPSVNEESKVVDLVEILISIWVLCVYLLNGNWEQLVLQTFPYTGNHQLREKFVLYFYANILKFYDLKTCQDIVTTSVLKDLVRFSPSCYLSELMRKLTKDKWDLFVFPNNDNITSTTIENSRLTVITSIIRNITHSRKCSKVEQRLFIQEILTTLNSEFEKYYSSTKYKVFCSSVVKEIQKQCDPDIVDESTVHNLASRVGILENEWTQFKIKKLPLKQKLQTFATEFHNALYFGGDYVSVLEKFTFGDGVELIYHLVSIYAQDILIGNSTKWRIIHVFLDFLDSNIRCFKFHILNVNFKRFLRLLMELPTIMCPISISDKFFRISAMRSICSILNFCKTLFNGYSDRNEIQDMWSSFKGTSRQEQYESQNLACSYSSFKLLDIIDGGFSNEPSFEDITQDTLDIAKRMLISETFLLKTNMIDSENRTLDFDFVF